MRHDGGRGDDVGIISTAKRLWRHPTLQTWISKTEFDVHQIAAKLDEVRTKIAAVETELSDVVLGSVLDGDDRATALHDRLAKLRTEQAILEQAAEKAADAEARRVAEAADREAASRRRAAAQHLGKAKREVSALVEAAAAVQDHYSRLVEASTAAGLLLAHPLRDQLGHLLEPYRIQQLTLVELHKAGANSPTQLVDRRMARAVGSVEVFHTGHIPPLTETLGADLEAIRRALSPRPQEQAPVPAGEGGVTGVAPGDATQTAPAPAPADDQVMVGEVSAAEPVAHPDPLVQLWGGFVPASARDTDQPA